MQISDIFVENVCKIYIIDKILVVDITDSIVKLSKVHVHTTLMSSPSYYPTCIYICLLMICVILNYLINDPYTYNLKIYFEESVCIAIKILMVVYNNRPLFECKCTLYLDQGNDTFLNMISVLSYMMISS